MSSETETDTTNDESDTAVFAALESEVQSYARDFPVVFDRADGVHIFDAAANAYLDFLAGAGSLNYGHNHPVLRNRLIEYIVGGGITHGLDLHTVAKADFLRTLNDLVLAPRGMDMVVQFTGPTGTNAVEAALKLARNVKARHNIIAFTNGFHGVSNGAMAATGNSHHRDAAGIPLFGSSSMPYDGYLGEGTDTLEYIDRMIGDASSGLDHPAAAIVETVQGEGGLNTASADWMRGLERLCRKHDMLLIVDDIQAGCGRTGTFFSFDDFGISPDIVTLSKSLSGYGLPFAVVLLKAEIDSWKPGQHNGTFRGNNHAFVTAAAALRHFWSDDVFASEVRRKARLLNRRLNEIADEAGTDNITVKGRGFMQGLCFADPEAAARITALAFERGMIIETSGPRSETVKCLPPLIIGDRELEKGLSILRAVTLEALGAPDKGDRDAA